MSQLDHFLLPPDQYVRDLDIVKNWLHTNATYLVKKEGADYDKAVEFCKKLISKSGKFPLNNPSCTIIDKDKNGDRYVRKTTYLAYLSNVAKKDLICSPSMTTYLQPSVRKSMLGLYINQNLGLRSKAKHEQLMASLSGNKELEKIKFNEQTSHKIFNNGISGAQSIGSTPLVLVSAHSTLTSGCRTATSTANATIEKFVAGSRHYFSAEAVRVNILTIITHFDREQMQATIDKYGLKVPTTYDIDQLIRWSTINYWQDEDEMEDIMSLVQTLDPLERCAFAYIGDFYHIRRFNPKVAMSFLDGMGKLTNEYTGDPIEIIKGMKGDHKTLAMVICGDYTKGKKIKEDIIEKNDVEAIGYLAGTYQNLINTLDAHRDFIQTFFATRNLPANVSRGKEIVRRSVVGSDTDSCLFTVREWVKWRHGEVRFDWGSQAIWHSMVFLVCQVVCHNLALIATGQGVSRKEAEKLEMKNEYAFSVFGLTNIAKHYYANQIVQEGVIFPEAKLEIKGVQFKDSNSPPELIKQNEDFLIDIMDQIYKTGHCNVMPVIEAMAEKERDVKRSIEKAEPRFLKAMNIKAAHEYTDPNRSPYTLYHKVWEKAFHKYGVPTTFPYRALRVSMELGNKTAIKEWVNSIEDPEIRQALKEIYVDTGKTEITSIVMPQECVISNGIPKEILQGVDLRTQVYRACRPFYLSLDSLGLPMVNDRLTNMIHDQL